MEPPLSIRTGWRLRPNFFFICSVLNQIKKRKKKKRFKCLDFFILFMLSFIYCNLICFLIHRTSSLGIKNGVFLCSLVIFVKCYQILCLIIQNRWKIYLMVMLTSFLFFYYCMTNRKVISSTIM